MKPEDQLIDRLLTVFGEPKVDNPDGYLAEFAKALRGYDAETLEAAGDAVIRKCKFWPRPAEVQEQCEIEGSRLLRLRSGGRIKDDSGISGSGHIPTIEECERANALVAELRKATSSMLVGGDKDSSPLPDVLRPAFEKMMRESPNRHLYEKPATLTERSRRMMGERD